MQCKAKVISLVSQKFIVHLLYLRHSSGGCWGDLGKNSHPQDDYCEQEGQMFNSSANGTNRSLSQ